MAQGILLVTRTGTGLVGTAGRSQEGTSSGPGAEMWGEEDWVQMQVASILCLGGLGDREGESIPPVPVPACSLPVRQATPE